jgi:hypothetical protein
MSDTPLRDEVVPVYGGPSAVSPLYREVDGLFLVVCLFPGTVQEGAYIPQDIVCAECEPLGHVESQHVHMTVLALVLHFLAAVFAAAFGFWVTASEVGASVPAPADLPAAGRVASAATLASSRAAVLSAGVAAASAFAATLAASASILALASAAAVLSASISRSLASRSSSGVC